MAWKVWVVVVFFNSVSDFTGQNSPVWDLQRRMRNRGPYWVIISQQKLLRSLVAVSAILD